MFLLRYICAVLVFWSPLFYSYEIVRQPFKYEMNMQKARDLYESAVETARILADQTAIHLFELIHDSQCLKELVSETSSINKKYKLKGFSRGSISISHFFVVRYAIASAMYSNFLYQSLVSHQYWELHRMYELMMNTAKMVSMSQGDIIEAMRFDKRFEVHQVYDGRTLVTFSDDVPKDLVNVMIKDVVFSDVFLINGKKMGYLKKFIDESETYPHYASKRMLLVMEELVAYVEILQKLFLLGSRDARYGLNSPKDSLENFSNYMKKIDVMCEDLFHVKYASLSVDKWLSHIFESLHQILKGGSYEEKELDKKIFPEYHVVNIAPLKILTQDKDDGEEAVDKLYSSSAPEKSAFEMALCTVAKPVRRKSYGDISTVPLSMENTIRVTRRYYDMLETLFTQRNSLVWNDFKSLMKNLGFKIKGVGGGSVFEFKMETLRFLVHRPHPKPEMNKGKLKWVALKLKNVYPNGLSSFSSR